MTPTPFLIYGKRGLFNSSVAADRPHHILYPPRRTPSAQRRTSHKFFSLIPCHSSLVTRLLPPAALAILILAAPSLLAAQSKPPAPAPTALPKSCLSPKPASEQISMLLDTVK